MTDFERRLRALFTNKGIVTRLQKDALLVSTFSKVQQSDYFHFITFYM